MNEMTINDPATMTPTEMLRNVSVLYVEDDDMVREEMERFMRRRVGALYIARDGREGLELWRRHRPDIVVTDIMMPVMDGLKMAEEIRREHHAVPIVVTTAYNEAGHFLRAIDIGIDKYVVKPIDGDLLERTLVKCAREVRAHLDLQLAATVFEASSNAIMVTDVRSRIVAVNPAFTEITGYARANVLGRTPALLASGLHGTAFYAEMYAKLADQGRWAGEVRNRHQGGQIYTEWLAINAVRDSSGAATHYVAIFTDITRRKENEQMLLEAKRAAEAASLAKSQFLATMSHEIRTPMNGILGMAQLLLMPELGDPERMEYARTILNSGQTLMTILNDILDLSKIDAGRMDLLSVVFEPRQLIEETVALFAETARKKGLSLAAAWTGEGSPRYWGDPIRLRQMLSNLLANAIKFTEHGGIHVAAQEIADGMLEFAVSDTGIGIAAEQRDKLFKPFSQVDASATRRYGGTGLGLSIVRRLAELMEGAVDVDSVLGQGATFHFRIPAQRVPEGEESRQSDRAPEAARRTNASTPARTCRILVAEDNATNRMVIEAILGKCGYAFISVENGWAAVETVTRGDGVADLVLMDCQMPVMNGFEATERIRAWEAGQKRPRLPIVALTASAFEEDRTRCLAAGMDDFLPKPVDVQELRAALQRWLEKGEPAN